MFSNQNRCDAGFGQKAQKPAGPRENSQVQGSPGERVLGKFAREQKKTARIQDLLQMQKIWFLAGTHRICYMFSKQNRCDAGFEQKAKKAASSRENVPSTRFARGACAAL